VGDLVLGRDRELGVLAAALDGAGRSVGRLVFLVGEAGIGKTTLLAESVRLAEARDMACAVGRCHQDQDLAPPYWPWIQVLRRLRRLGALGDAHAGLLRALQPDPDGGGAGDDRDRAHSRFEIADRIVHALAEAAEDRPVLVGIDDLHAADPSSLRIVEFLAAVLDDLPLAVVATSRVPQPDTSYEALLVDTLRHPAASELVVPGLSAGDVAAYLQAALGHGDDVADDVWHLTAGNPMYVREVARILGDSAPGPLDRVPVRLTGALRTRLSALGPPTRRVLDALAVLGVDADLALLSGVAGDDIDLDAALADAVAAEVVEVTAAGRPTTVRFRHPLLREAVYADLAAAARVALHDRAARVLASRPSPPADALAVHLCAAARPETATAAVAAARSAAARAAAVHAHEEAAAHLRRAQAALVLSPDHRPTEAVALLLAAAAAYRDAGRFDQALDRYGQGYAGAEDAGEADLRAQAALGYEETVCESGQPRSGTADRSIVQLERVVERADDLVDLAVRARAMAALARAWFFVNQGEAAESLADDAVRAARSAGDAEAIAFALECLRTVTWARADRKRRAALCAEIAQQASDGGALGLVLQARHFALYPALEAGDLSEVDRLVAEYGGLADQARQPHARCYAALFRSMRAIQRAELVAARRHLDAAEALDGRIRSLNVAQFCTAQRFSIARLTGEWADLPARFAAFVGPTGSGPTWRCMTAHLAAEAGDGDTAHAELESMAHAGYRGVSDDAHYLFSLCCLAEAAVILADRRRSAELLDLLLPYRDRVVPNITALHGSVAHACGGLALACGDRTQARALLDAALATHLALGATTWVALSRLRLAEALRSGADDGDRARAGELLDAVAAAAEARGLTRLGQRASRLLGRPPPERSPLDQLTARELDVVALLAEGRSNSEISRELYISLKTVKSHVSHVLTKLGVTSRTQVALLVQRARWAPGGESSPAYQSKDR
jgi:DNA-binding CsgD family transcriptional regulator